MPAHRFAVKGPDEARQQARADAVADAQAWAQALAKLGGAILGPVMSMSEIVGGGPVLACVEAAQGAGGPPINPGEIAFTYQVPVVFLIAD